MKLFYTLSLFILFLTVAGFSDMTFSIVSLDGSAKVQRVQKKEWDKLTIGMEINDNDIVETYFQAKLVLQFGKGNIIILGSNSKALVNIRAQKNDATGSKLDVNLTIFSGGCFVKAIADCHISVYSSNAVGETDNGSFSTVVDAKSGETGFQSLGGSTKARNIAQKEGIKLSSGQTTMISPGKEPTAPLYMTVRHVAVLKHFFGDDYIETELELAGIKPTEERASGAGQMPLSMAQQFSVTSRDQGMYKNPFSLNKIYNSILTERKKEHCGYSQLSKPVLYQDNKLMLEEYNDFFLVNGGMLPAITARPSYTAGIFSAGLRLTLATNYTGQMSLYSFSSGQGILDLIDHVTLGPFGDSTFVNLSPICNYTLGNGLVVDNFNAQNPYSLFHPLGLTAQLQADEFTTHVFVADVSTFSIGGVYLQWEPSIYFFGAGVYFDGNQFERPKDSAQYRFSNLYRSDSSVSSNVFIYQLDFHTEVLSRYDCTVSFGCGFAQKIAGAATDGFVFNAPEINFNYIDLSFGAGLVFESGRMIKGQFNDFSMGNRSYIIQGLSGHPDTFYTQNTLLSTRLARGRFDATFGMNIRPGLAVQAELLPTLYQRNAIAIDSTAKISGIDWRLSLSVNDSLIPLIRYGNIYFQQTGTNVYPPRNTFISWGFNAGVGAISNPVIYGIGANAGFSLWYLDLNANNSIDPKDMIVQFSLGFYKGF